MNYNKKVGEFGEILAKKYLIKHGYSIIAMNKKISSKEIDIIAKKHKRIIFIEVKTRTSEKYGEASDFFNISKINNLKIALEKYIYENKIDEKYVQIDLIAVDINKYKKIANIKHFKNIF